MVAHADMNRHFAEVSPIYRSVRTTDREPIERIARELQGLARPRGADVGCGAGRYVLLMFEAIPNLSLACIDASPAMLGQVDELLRANGIDDFETKCSTAESLELEPGRYDFVSTFNAVHHFDFPAFLRKSRQGLTEDGRLFVYTRLPEHNARSIWGRHFPGFAERETRLLTLGDIHGAIEDTPGLRFVGATCQRYHRRGDARTPRRAGQEPTLLDVLSLRSGRIRRRTGDLPGRSRASLLPTRSNGTTRTSSFTQRATTADRGSTDTSLQLASEES